MFKKDLDNHSLALLAKIILTRILAKHNFHLVAGNHFIHLISTSFCDFKITQAFSIDEAVQTLFLS